MASMATHHAHKGRIHDRKRFDRDQETKCSCQAGAVHTWDGTGLCLFTKRLEEGRFAWPSPDEAGDSVRLTSAQLSMLIEGIDWRTPERRWRLALAG